MSTPFLDVQSLTTETQRTVQPRQVALLLEANGGDRRGNLAASLQKLRSMLEKITTSSLYEVDLANGQAPSFVIACLGTTVLPDAMLHRRVRALEVSMTPTGWSGAHQGVVHLLLLDTREEQSNTSPIWHDALYAPLAEIAPTWREPTSGQLVTTLVRQAKASITKRGADLRIPLSFDLQNSRPTVATRLDRAGVVGIQKVLAMGDAAVPHWQTVTFDLYADLPANRAGIHMSRFSDALAEVLEELGAQIWPGIDQLAEHLAKRIVAKQQVQRAEVRIQTIYPLQRWTPVSGQPTQECYGLLAEALATPTTSRKLLGVQVQGMVACPCAQDMVKAFTNLRLSEEGIDEGVIGKVLSLTPLATHNQRGCATVLLGTDEQLDARDLVDIAEQAMSSENYGLLKRPDELYIVNKAHAHPRFVEDVVREILRGVVAHYPTLPESAFVFVHQENKETIHKYDVEATAWGTLGELRAELEADAVLTQRTTKEAWLAGGNV